MPRILAVSDEVDEALWHDPSRLPDIDLVVACGDLPFDYLDRLLSALDVPLVFVPGNHDPDLSGYRDARNGLVLRAGLPAEPPWPSGARNADGRVLDAAGIRLAGLGGSPRYAAGPNQYTQRQQAHRVARLVAAARWRRFHDGHRVDVVLTHAPPLGVGDAADPAHVGFAALHRLVDRLAPQLLLHGHVHPYGSAPPERRLGRTAVRNVVGRHVLDVPTTQDAGVRAG